jgi:hypothetical protein
MWCSCCKKNIIVKIVHPKKVSHQYNYFKLHWSYLHFSERRAVRWYILTTDILIFWIPQIRKYIYVITIVTHVIRHYYYYYIILSVWHSDASIGLGQHTAWWLYNGSSESLNNCTCFEKKTFIVVYMYVNVGHTFVD